MFPISRIPAAPNLHKLPRTEIAEPTGEKRTRTETVIDQGAPPKSNQLQQPAAMPIRHFNLLGRLAASRNLGQYMMEWLTEKESLQLMQTGKPLHEAVTDFYISRLKPTLKQQPDTLLLTYPSEASLALNADQLNELHKAGLLEELAGGRMTLSAALRRLERGPFVNHVIRNINHPTQSVCHRQKYHLPM